MDAARATFAQNAVDLLTDCPSRERAGWLCDAFFTGRAEVLFTGGNDAERAFLENFALAPSLASLPDGMVPMCYPAEHVHGTFIPNWALWWLLELDAYRARTGDEETVAASRPALWERLCTEFGPSRDAARTWPDVPPSNAIVGAYLRLELLLRDGRAEQCLRECRGFFLPMVRLTGTLWENLSPQASLNHGFASSAAWLIRRALAVSPRPDRRNGG